VRKDALERTFSRCLNSLDLRQKQTATANIQPRLTDWNAATRREALGSRTHA